MTSRRLRVELQGAVYTTLDWSLSGFRIGGYTGHLRVGDRAPVRLCGSSNDGELDAYVIAKVVRVNREKGQLAVTYVALPNGALQTLRRIAGPSEYRDFRPRHLAHCQAGVGSARGGRTDPCRPMR